MGDVDYSLVSLFENIISIVVCRVKSETFLRTLKIIVFKVFIGSFFAYGNTYLPDFYCFTVLEIDKVIGEEKIRKF